MTGSGLPDQAEDDAAGDKSTNKDYLEEHIEFHNGRQRRRAIFRNDADQSDLMVLVKYYNDLVLSRTTGALKGLKGFSLVTQFGLRATSSWLLFSAIIKDEISTKNKDLIFHT